MMKQVMVALVASIVAVTSASAEGGAHQSKARDVYERIISFRTAEGHALLRSELDRLLDLAHGGIRALLAAQSHVLER